MNRLTAARLLACAGLCVALMSAPAGAATFTPDTREMQELNSALQDPAQVPRVVARARQLLAMDIDPNYQIFLRQLVLRGAMAVRGPVNDVLSAADSLKPFLGDDVRSNMQFSTFMARALLERGDALTHAHAYAAEALKACPDGPAWTMSRAESQALLGAIEVARGRNAEAITLLTAALPAASDSHAVLLALGRAYAGADDADRAIDAYVRAAGTFPCKDTTGRASLNALYAKRHKGTRGLDARIDASCAASRRLIALDSRRHEQPAPEWSLRDMDGKTVQFSDYKGKVLVIDFWGSWCGPCRAELPHFQAMYERYRDRGVAFVGVSWERVQTREDAVRASRRFMEQNRLSFPNLVDHERLAVEAYGVDSFPTVFLIDKTGKVRYRNIGFTEDISDIMAAQIESLIK